MRLSVCSPDPYCPDPVVATLSVIDDRAIRVALSWPDGSPVNSNREITIRRHDADRVDVLCRWFNGKRITFPTERGPVRLGTREFWAVSGVSWSTTLADALATLIRDCGWTDYR